MAFIQPLTARQIAWATGIPMDTCSQLIKQFSHRGILACLNSKQRNSRLYWLTTRGRSLRMKLYQRNNLPYKEYDLPKIDWSLYGWVCFNHRSAVIKALSGSMQPSEIKRYIRIHHPRIRISANNIRDIIKLLVARNVVQAIQLKGKSHPRYQLTELGLQLQRLLRQAQAGY